MSAEQTRKLIALAAIWAALLLAPYWMVPLGGYTALATRVLVLGLAAMSLNFLLGFTGVLSFGHAAYFGLGAYGAGLTLKFLAPSTPLALLLGMLLGGICGAILGTLIVRRRGVYFAMVTIAFGQVFYYIAFQWSSLTGGDDGLRGFSRQPIDLGFFKFDILSNEKNFYFFVLFCFALAVGAMGFILRSPFGRTMIAIRENERRSRFLGIPVERHIWIAFTLSCFFMGFAGALYALVNNFADPRGLHYSQSGDFVMMAVMGGMRSFWGPLLGAAVFVVLQDYLSSITVNWMSFVGKGELCAIIGPNGAGKTTFFNLISGFFPPTSGAINFDGRDITRLSTHQRVTLGMARTFQITEIFPELTVFENVRIAAEVAGGYRLRPWINRAETAKIHQHVEATLKLVSLETKTDRLVGELAHGDQRAAEIAMALALNPHLLLLDEPTAGMGDQETYQITQLIRRLHRESNYTIVLIEHDMRVVFHLADRICVLDQGRMLAQGTPQEIAANEPVQAAYLGNAA